MAKDVKSNKDNNEILLEVKNLKKYFPIHKGFIKRETQYVKAVDDVSFYIRKASFPVCSRCCPERICCYKV